VERENLWSDTATGAVGRERENLKQQKLQEGEYRCVPQGRTALYER